MVRDAEQPESVSAMVGSIAWALNRARAQTLSLVADVPEDAMQLQASPSEQNPTWLLGHVLLADSYLLFLLTSESLPDDFGVLLERYGPASTPVANTPYDSKDQLVDRLRHTNSVRTARVSAMSADDLAAPLGDERLAPVQPTIGHHLQSLIFHEGYHAGQISSWRRAHGFAAVGWAMGPV